MVAELQRVKLRWCKMGSRIFFRVFEQGGVKEDAILCSDASKGINGPECSMSIEYALSHSIRLYVSV